MIEKIRRALIIKYTVIIACILLIGFVASYIAYRHNGIKMLQDGLKDYLTEELWEAKDFLRHNENRTEIRQINADIKSLHNFTYWLVNKKPVLAELPADGAIAAKLERRILSKNYEPQKIYRENIKHNKQKWYFLLLKDNLQISSSQNAEVFVLANYTPVRKSAKTYVKTALLAVLVIILLAHLVGSFFAARSMQYIEQSFIKQKRFVSDAAHELRTPLAVLYAYAELLEYNPRKKEVLADIKDEIRQMNKLVDRLLTLARYDNSVVVLQKECFLLNDLAAFVIRSMQNISHRTVFKLVNDFGDIKIEADKAMIRQLLGILLDNAVKHGKKNKKITLKLIQEGSDVKIFVIDNGVGIKKEDMGHIFERFFRAEKSRHQKGLGLGLSLAAEIVKLHNGTISVKSKEFKGTVFMVTLPQEKNGA